MTVIVSVPTPLKESLCNALPRSWTKRLCLRIGEFGEVDGIGTTPGAYNIRNIFPPVLMMACKKFEIPKHIEFQVKQLESVCLQMGVIETRALALCHKPCLHHPMPEAEARKEWIIVRFPSSFPFSTCFYLVRRDPVCDHHCYELSRRNRTEILELKLGQIWLLATPHSIPLDFESSCVTNFAHI